MGKSWEPVSFWAFWLSILTGHPICFHGYFHCTVYKIYIYIIFFFFKKKTKSWRNTRDLDKAPSPWSTEQSCLSAGPRRDWISAEQPGRNRAGAPAARCGHGASLRACRGPGVLFQRDNNQWLELDGTVGRGDGYGVEQVPHPCFYFVAQGREFCWTLHCHRNWD